MTPFQNSLFILLLLQYTVDASLKNITVDDQYGDPSNGLIPYYAPANKWNIGASCPSCRAKPDPSKAFMNSWHDTSSIVSQPAHDVAIMFNGTAVYVYCIIANTFPRLTNITFKLDNNIVGNYHHAPDNTTTFLYNIPVYANTSLPDVQHVLIMEQVPGSLILFDYLIYTINATNSVNTDSGISTSLPAITTTTTYPDTSNAHSNSPKASQPNVRAIIGGVVGSVATLILAAIAFQLLRRKTKSLVGTNNHGHSGAFSSSAQIIPTPYVLYTTSDIRPGKSTNLPNDLASFDRNLPQLSSSGLAHTVHPVVGNERTATLIKFPGSKAAIHREDILQQVRQREQLLVSSRGTLRYADPSSSLSPSIPIPSSSGVQIDATVASQIAQLRREMEGLREQQQQVMNDSEGPPQYE